MKWLFWLAATIALSFFVRSYCCAIFLIPSNSMSPTLEIGDRILCNKLQKSNFKNGDIILFWKPQTQAAPKQHSYIMAKRITGIAGNFYTKKEDTLQQKFALSTTTKTAHTNTIPKNHYFVQGDNSDNSIDSRYWGLVADSLIIGKAQCIVWSNWHPNLQPKDRHFVWNRFLKGL